MRSWMLAVSTAALLGGPATFAADAPPDPEGNLAWTLDSVPPGKLLDVNLRTGAHLRITTWDRNQVSMVSDLTEERCRDARISFTRTPDGVRVESRYPDNPAVVDHNCSFSIDVRVPKQFDVRLRSAGGTVDIRNLKGTVIGLTGGGRLTIAGMEGTVRLRTGGGSIYVSDSDLEGHLTTGGGEIQFRHVTGPVTARSGSRRGVVRGLTRAT
jgi:hypothetical protein